MRHTLFVATLIAVGLTVPLRAHITIVPADSRTGATERYTVRAPTEGQVSTTGVALEIPAGVTVINVLASGGWKSELRREGTRIVGIDWKVDIPAGHFGELVFSARNPREGIEIVWKVTQRFADGTSREWTSTTKLAAAQ